MAVLDIDVLSPEVYRDGDPEQNGLPHAAYALLRADAPCYRHKLHDPMMIPETWVVTRHADVARVNRDGETFCNGAGPTLRAFTPFEPDKGGRPAMIAMDGAEHRRNRRTVNRGFTPNVVKTFENHFRAVAADLVSKAVHKGEFDFVPDLAVEMPLTAISDLMGVPHGDRQKFLAWVNAIAVPTDPNFAPSLEDSMTALANLWSYGLELAEHRRKEPGEDLMSRIVEAHAEDMLSEDELQGLMVMLAGAGTDTTRNTLTHGLHALLRHPAQMAWLRDHADSIPMSAVQELVRWASPVIHFRRTATRDTHINEQPIKKGETVTMLFAAANFDETVIPDPMSFDLSRQVNPHLSFGVGPHACLGKHIAAVEIRVFFEELLKRTSHIEQVGPIGYVRDNFFRGAHTLPVSVRRS
ncbi:linalool 8-monooxygenase [Mycolicibacterium mucogenicum]|uniref:Steroid C26-monooxygenase n=1 Tax=Mycolicibacterium mucogenicum TaxID=56689 RepID=A0A1A3H4E4_MYCMU|nr:cytochrome P450 [Mycolicibacterium mucogenicum]OBJ42498.1 linalool 8-monooxygenase [Mycolicibacterium mucogenicum]